MTAQRHAASRGRERGFIVVAVLWIIGALATLAATYAFYVANAAGALSVNDDRIRANALVTAGVELAVYRMNIKPSANTEPVASDAFRFRMGAATITAEYRPENARIDINAAGKPLLAGLFQSLGATPDNAAIYADRIIGWRTVRAEGVEDAELGLYRAAGLTYGPRQAAFVHTDEIWRVVDLPLALVERALPYLTVYSGQADVNIQNAEPAVLAALPGMTPQRMDLILNTRGGRQTEALSGLNTGNARPSRARRITVQVGFDNGRRTGAEIVVLMTDNGPEPYRVLSWRSDFDSAGARAPARRAGQ